MNVLPTANQIKASLGTKLHHMADGQILQQIDVIQKLEIQEENTASEILAKRKRGVCHWKLTTLNEKQKQKAPWVQIDT